MDRCNSGIENCPIAEKITEQAAEKAVQKFVLLIGYDVTNSKDLKEIRSLVSFVESANTNIGRVKMVALLTFVSSVVGGAVGFAIKSWS